MNTISLGYLPKECWIYEKHQYRLNTFSNIQPRQFELPHIHKDYEFILKAYGIPYRTVVRNSLISYEVCEYWNPDMYEEKPLTLPLFAKIPNGSYIYTEKNHTQKSFTVETIAAAIETQKFVDSKIAEYEEIWDEVELYQYAKRHLAGQASRIVYTITEDSRTAGLNPYISREIDMNKDNFKIFKIREWIVFFDMNKIKPHGYVELKVPKYIAGLVIGVRASVVKRWAEDLGVKKIQLVPI